MPSLYSHLCAHLDSHLQERAPELNSPRGVCVLVLSVLVARFYARLQPAVCAVLVRSLTSLLRHPAELHRLAAAELIGKGFHT